MGASLLQLRQSARNQGKVRPHNSSIFDRAGGAWGMVEAARHVQCMPDDMIRA